MGKEATYTCIPSFFVCRTFQALHIFYFWTDVDGWRPVQRRGSWWLSVTLTRVLVRDSVSPLDLQVNALVGVKWYRPLPGTAYNHVVC